MFGGSIYFPNKIPIDDKNYDPSHKDHLSLLKRSYDILRI